MFLKSNSQELNGFNIKTRIKIATLRTKINYKIGIKESPS